MSKTTTFTFSVVGDSYEDIVAKANNIIARFMSSPDEDEFDDDNSFVSQGSGSRVNYEILVSVSEDISSEYEYEAQVIAKIRD